MISVKLKKLNPNAIIPTRGSEHAAGYDLYVALDGDELKSIEIPAHATVKVGTGLALSVPDGYFGAIFARSGIATNRGLRPANCVGVVDSDYTGEIIVALHNDTDLPQAIELGERIAQLVIMPYQSVSFTEVDEMTETQRGDSGFGQSGRM